MRYLKTFKSISQTILASALCLAAFYSNLPTIDSTASAKNTSSHVVSNDSHGNTKSKEQKVWEANLASVQKKTDADKKALIQTKKDYDAQVALKEKTTTQLKSQKPIDIIKTVRSMPVTGKPTKAVVAPTTKTQPAKNIVAAKKTAWQKTNSNVKSALATQKIARVYTAEAHANEVKATSQKIAQKKNPILKVFAPLPNLGLSPMTLFVEALIGLSFGFVLPLSLTHFLKKKKA